MNYNFFEISFPSHDGKHTVYAEIYTPKNREAKGIVQLAHGMIDYVGRYKELADYLTGEGYIFAGHNHLGHGKTASCREELGFFSEKNGVEYVIADMHRMNKYLRTEYPSLPLILFGHSMGSFITRLYIEKHPHSMQKAIIHGTAGPNMLLPFGKTLAKLIKFVKGPMHRSKLIKSLAFGSYNKKFPKEEGSDAWLTREISLVSSRPSDKFTNFTFTVSAYIDLFEMIQKCNTKEWFDNYPKELPTLVISGDMDPVGDYGKGPDYIYKKLLIAGCKSVSLKMYEGARHELFNETNRTEVFADIARWIES